jgi:dipeptidyl aminopeptidase/acylaminoacyl peptidase
MAVLAVMARRSIRRPVTRHSVTRRISRLVLPLIGVLGPGVVHPQTPDRPAARPLALEDAFTITQFHALTGQAAALSPDGEWVAYTACQVAKIKLDPTVRNQNAPSAWAATNRMGCDVRGTNTTTADSRDLTRGLGNSWGPSWSPDGRFLAFYSDRSGAPQGWLWERHGGAIRRLSAAVARTTSEWEVPVWSPDSRRVLVKLRPAGITDAELQDVMPPTAGSRVETAGYPKATVVVYRSPGATQQAAGVPMDSTPPRLVDNAWLGDLALVDVGTGRTRILARQVRSTCYLFSPDGSEIAYLDSTGRMTGGNESIAAYYTRAFNIVVVSIATARSRVLSRDVRQWLGTSLSWSPDGKWLAYISGSATIPNTYRFGYAVRGDLYVVPSAGGQSRKFAGAPDNLFENDEFGPLWDPKGDDLHLIGGARVWRATVATGQLMPITQPLKMAPEAIVQVTSPSGGRVWSPDGGASMYVMSSDSLTKRSGVYKIRRVSGEVTSLREEDEYDAYPFHPPVGSADGRRVFYRAERASASADLWVADPTFDHPRRLTTLNPRLARYTLGEARRIDFVSADGKPLQAALLPPTDYVEGKQFPLVVWVYAGAYGSQQLNVFGLIGGPFNMQVLSTRGYAVLVPDIPVHMGTPVQDLMNAVMPAIDRVVALGIADPKRLAVMGQSNGGYSTLALLTRTTCFKAAVMNAGFGNLPAMYGYMTPGGLAPWIPWLERVTGAIGAPPWEAPQRYVENSPIFSLDRVQTPLLIQVGGADDGFVPWNNEVFVGLRRLGREVTYLRYEGEGHYLREVPNQVDYWNRVLAFLDTHMNGHEGAGEHPK